MENQIVKIGDELIIEIKKQGINGEGIGYHNKLAVFVQGAILRETVKCRITTALPTYAQADLLSIEKPSEKRVISPCPYYQDCGGCQMQHIAYDEQRKIKQSILKQSLRRYTELDVDRLDILNTIGMAKNFGYRNKSQMPIRNTNLGLSLGLYRPNSNHFVPIEDCLVQDPIVNSTNRLVLALLKEHGLLAYDAMNKEGVLLHLVTRHFASTGDIQISFVVTKPLAVLREIAREIMNKLAAVKSINFSVNTAKSTAIFGRDVFLLAGVKEVETKYAGMMFKVAPDAFHQLNDHQMDILYKIVIELMGLTGNEVVIDAFSGIGITSLLFAKLAKKVYGVDFSTTAIASAKQNAKTNKIMNAEFIADRVERWLPEHVETVGIPDVLVFDPPRTGLDDSIIALLNRIPIPKVIYVSCNQSTLAKNLARLSAEYRVESIRPIDMFPHTASVESITLLTRREIAK